MKKKMTEAALLVAALLVHDLFFGTIVVLALLFLVLDDLSRIMERY